MLWIYAENDSFFEPRIAKAMHEAFTATAGQATLVQPGSFSEDGHRLFYGNGGSAVWGGRSCRPTWPSTAADRQSVTHPTHMHR